MKALTEFGLEVRKLRLEKRMRLLDLAEKVGVSAAFLSAVETGSKAVPTGLPEKIAKALVLDDLATQRLCRAAASSVRTVRLDLSDTDEKAQELAVAFARRFPSMDRREVEQFLSMLTETGSVRKKER